jgi:Glycosyl transferase family 2
MDKVREAVAFLPPGISYELADTNFGLATVDLKGTAASHAASNLFARVNGYPTYDEGLLESFRNSEQPLISCVVLLPFNDLFVRNVLLPSIIWNSRSQPIEILIVFAGFGVDRQPFRHLRQFESELTSIAKGYNLGARHAHGEYLALFHDDCFLDDPLWIEKAISALDNGAAAVTPEFDYWRQVPVAKAVPLVLRRADFIAAGGYDDYYYAGVEDMDLTVTLLQSGRDVRQLPIGYRHLRGMGTSLIVHQDPHQLKLLFGYQILPSAVIELVHRDMMQRLLENSWIRMLEGDYHLHFLKKHGQYLASCFAVDIPPITYVYESMRHAHLLTPEMAYMTNRERLVEAYSKLMNTAELRKPIHNGSGLV